MKANTFSLNTWPKASFQMVSHAYCVLEQLNTLRGKRSILHLTLAFCFMHFWLENFMLLLQHSSPPSLVGNQIEWNKSTVHNIHRSHVAVSCPFSANVNGRFTLAVFLIIWKMLSLNMMPKTITAVRTSLCFAVWVVATWNRSKIFPTPHFWKPG